MSTVSTFLGSALFNTILIAFGLVFLANRF
jgi:hypothetical protein